MGDFWFFGSVEEGWLGVREGRFIGTNGVLGCGVDDGGSNDGEATAEDTVEDTVEDTKHRRLVDGKSRTIVRRSVGSSLVTRVPGVRRASHCVESRRQIYNEREVRGREEMFCCI